MTHPHCVWRVCLDKKQLIIADELLCSQGDVFRTTFPFSQASSINRSHLAQRRAGFWLALFSKRGKRHTIVRRGKILKIDKVCLVINLVQRNSPIRGGLQ